MCVRVCVCVCVTLQTTGGDGGRPVEETTHFMQVRYDYDEVYDLKPVVRSPPKKKSPRSNQQAQPSSPPTAQRQYKPLFGEALALHRSLADILQRILAALAALTEVADEVSLHVWCALFPIWYIFVAVGYPLSRFPPYGSVCRACAQRPGLPRQSFSRTLRSQKA